MRPIHPATQEKLKQFNQASLKWLMGRISYMQENRSIPGAMNAGNYRNPKLFMMGEVFLYHYDPKWKHKLPYYDKFPLVIPLEQYDDGFLGVNLHYLPPQARLAFLNKLMTLVYTSPGDSRTRMRVSYEILKNSQEFNAYVPCLKRYLISHVEGRILKIQPHEWLMAAYLPIANWKRTNDAPGNAREVYRDSMKTIRNRK